MKNETKGDISLYEKFCKSRKKYLNKISEEKEVTGKSCFNFLSPKQTIRRLPQPLFILKPAMNPEI